MAWRRRVSDQVTQQKNDQAETSTGLLCTGQSPALIPGPWPGHLRLLIHRFQSQLGRTLKEKWAKKRDPFPGPIPE